MSEVFEEPQRPCPSCGSQVKQENKFCTTCGGLMSATPEGTEQGAARKSKGPRVLRAFLFDLTSNNSLRGKMSGHWQGMVGWAEDLGMAQKILLTLLVLSSAYMLIFYAGLFLALLLMLGLALATTWFSEKSYQRFASTIQRHQVLSGVCLLVIVCSTPILVPAIGALLVGVAVTAGVIGIVWLFGWLIMQAVEAERVRKEEHRRWYNSLSESEKQTYQLEQQTKIAEQQMWQQYWQEQDRRRQRRARYPNRPDLW